MKGKEQIVWNGKNIEAIENFLRGIATVFVYDGSCLVIDLIDTTKRQLLGSIGCILEKQDGILDVRHP